MAPTSNELRSQTYEEKDRQLQIEQNEAIRENTFFTKITLLLAIIATVGTLVSAIHDFIQIFK